MALNEEGQIDQEEFEMHKLKKKQFASYPVLPLIFRNSEHRADMEEREEETGEALGLKESVYRGFRGRIRNWERDHAPHVTLSTGV